MPPPGFQSVIGQPDLPVPREVLTKLGGGLRNATRFAARAQSFFGAEVPDIFDVDTFPADAPGLRSRLAEMRMRTALATPRVFRFSLAVLRPHPISSGPPHKRSSLGRPHIFAITSHRTGSIFFPSMRPLVCASGIRKSTLQRFAVSHVIVLFDFIEEMQALGVASLIGVIAFTKGTGRTAAAST
jgi:hypothetical protein